MDREELLSAIKDVIRDEVTAAFSECEVRKARGMPAVVVGPDCREDREQVVGLVADALRTSSESGGFMKKAEAHIAQGAVAHIFQEVFSVEVIEDSDEVPEGEWRISVGRVKRRTDEEILDCAVRAISLCRQALQPSAQQLAS